MTNSPFPGWWKVTMWGMSPACDLLELIDEKKLGSSSTLDKKEINILLVGQKDIRHSLETMKANWKTLVETGVRLNFYVVESCLELYARQLLFWKMAFKPNSKWELNDKVEQFAEVHGNSMIRPETWKTVTSFSDSLINILTGKSNSSQEYLMPILDFSEVKYQERNRIIEIIEFWTDDSSPEPFDMSLHWNNRVRQYFGALYNDGWGWDLFISYYYKNVVTKGLLIINTVAYDKFRSLGVGFMWWEEDKFIQPNLTLVSTFSEKPGSHGVGQYGTTNYWGDILTGPFICHGNHGIACEDSSDITIRNLQDIFNVISNDPLPDAESTTDNHEPTGQNQNPDISVHFVSMSNFHEFPSNLKYKEFFDVVYFGNSMIDELLPSLTPLFAPDAILFAENARYAFDLPPAEEKLFTTKINEVAANMGFQQIKSFNSKAYKYDNFGQNGVVKPSILKYVMKPQENYINRFMIWIQRILNSTEPGLII